jgi:RHS repeat-associated protein
MHCLAPVPWAGKYIWLDHSLRAAPPGNPDLWVGSLVQNKRDLTGNIYMRNRYYDPATGRFTQEDPIGLAGGLNAYGFAAGDPVSYSDPYGLCPYGKENPDTNTADCPADRMGDAIRALDAYGGHIGIEVISTIAREGLNPNLVDRATIEKECGTNALACTTASGLIYMNEAWSVGALAVGVTHEVFHVELGDTRDTRWYRFHEHSAWDRSMWVHEWLPTNMRGVEFARYYQWWKTDRQGFHNAITDAICSSRTTLYGCPGWKP